MTQTTPIVMDDVVTLRERIKGDVVTSGDEGWDAARAAWNLAVDQQPALVAFPESSADVVEIVGFARAHGLSVAAQGTGHGAAGLGPLANAILVKTERMRAVTIDPVTRVARAEAGAIWTDVTVPAAEHGLAALAGSSGDVGVVGYTLGGGIGFLARQYGTASGSVQAVELVTADAELKRVDAEHDADLFWALRGGGGTFGVVTAIEFSLHPVREVYAGDLFWPVERCEEILTAWSDWIREVPDEVTSLGRILHLPPLPQLPEFLRGRSFVMIELAYAGSEDAGAGLIKPLRALGPEIDTVGVMPPSRLSELHMDPPEPVPAAGDGVLMRTFGADAVRALDAAAGPSSGTPLLSVEIRHLGGALARPSAEPCACTLADAEFAMFAVGMVMSPEMGVAVEHAIDGLLSKVSPYSAGRSTPNFAERTAPSSDKFPPDVYERLKEVRSRYDRDGVLLSNLPLS